MLVRRIHIVMWLAALSSIGGCNRAMNEVTVGEHIFRVPELHLANEEARAAGRRGHLRFIVNPEAALEEQILVGVDSSQGTCQPQNPPTSTMLAKACQASQTARDNRQGQKFKPEKVFTRENQTHWEYRVPDGDGGYDTVAGCYALTDGRGLCRSINNYKDLIYSVGFRDSEISDLPEIWARVNQLLDEWEVEE